MIKRLSAELIGTFWLVFCGCGSAILAASFPATGIGFVGVSLAFGLSVVTMGYALGSISGGHFNPAVSFGLAVSGRFAWADVLPYWFAQVFGSVLGAGALLMIASGKAGFLPGAFASNGYGALSPGHYSMAAAFLTEAIMTAAFLIVILGATRRDAAPVVAPLAIGLALTLIHLVSIPVTNTSVNPARSSGVAFVAGNGTLSQLWLFWLAPLFGALLGAVAWKALFDEDDPR